MAEEPGKDRVEREPVQDIRRLVANNKHRSWRRAATIRRLVVRFAETTCADAMADAMALPSRSNERLCLSQRTPIAWEKRWAFSVSVVRTQL